MGDPKRIRKKYSTPIHPWQAERLEEEKELTRQYGFRNKTEIWKMNSVLRTFLRQAKRLSAEKTEQAEKEKTQLLNRLKKLGLLPETASLDDVLDISLKDLLERRLQTIVFRKGLSRSVKQARQFIVHRHILVDKNKITVPSYLVSKSEESLISFIPSSSLSSADHPERKQEEKKEAPKKEKTGKKPKKADNKKEVKKKEGAKPKAEKKEEKAEETKEKKE